MWAEAIPDLDPVEAAARLRPLGHLAFLDSAMAHETLGRFSYLAADPFAVLTVDGTAAHLDGAPLAGRPAEAMRRVLARFPIDPLPGLPPFQGGAIGRFAYEFGRHFETLTAPPGLDPRTETARLPLYDTVLAFDLVAGTAFVMSSGHPEADAAGREARARRRLAAFRQALARPAPPVSAPAIPAAAFSSNFDRETFGASVEALKEAIRDGAFYQANLAQTFEAARPAGFDAFALHARLRRLNPAPFAAFLEGGPSTIVSSSPERFLALRGREIETRPIKGTAARPPDPDAEPEADRAAAAALLASEKDRAENVMIVDLLRNDLARVAEPASVAVPVLCGLETYAGVHHLVSAVTARLAEGRDGLDLLAAAFPGGSITGAPKIAAMEAVTALEKRPRGAYCGAIGWLGFDGAMDLNVAIRTVEIGAETIRFSAGGGITLLSDAQAEYDETLAKAERLFRAFGAAS